jgi:signal transduction histidine kinase
VASLAVRWTEFRMRALLWALMLIAAATPALAATRHVVVLYDERPTLPGLAVIDASLADALSSRSAEPVELYREAMDLSRLASDVYEPLLKDHLRQKYAGLNVDVVIAVMGPALEFLLRHGEEMFPGTPIVFGGVDRQELGNRPLPANVTGVLVTREFLPTLEVALALHPDTRHVAYVAGTSEFDRRLTAQARTELAAFSDRVELTYLTELPFDRLLEELSALQPSTIVLYSTLFRDGAVQAFVPHEAARRVSQAANAPVYGFMDQYLGYGIVGGQLYTLRTHGEHAAQLVLQILAGAAPAELPLIEPQSAEKRFDSRELERWDITERQLPAGSTVAFADASLWGEYRYYALVAAAVVVVQALAIGGLLVQRTRRRRAEIETHQQRAEIAHLNRVVTTGQLAASIAHEINQPLTAIMANAATLQVMLSSREQIPDEVREVLADICKDDQRAAEIIRSMRSLLRKHEIADGPVDINELVSDIVKLLHAEAVTRNIRVSFEPDDNLPPIRGDRVHLQQVMMNLMLNGFDAMSEAPPDARRLTVRTTNGGGAVQIDVRDAGTGISTEKLSKLFEPFQSTKKDGLGIGLSITRSIVEAHGGRVWAENNHDAGATFHVSLRALRRDVR